MDLMKLFDENEKPLDNIVPDGGFCKIFRTIGCIGDSLAAGEMESLDENGNKGFFDMFEYSWGEYMARDIGAVAHVFAKGGLTAKEFCESFAPQNDCYNPEKRCQAYIIALGINDISYCGNDLGSVDDIDVQNWENNKKSFAGYFGEIISRYKKIQPKAKFFLVTMPHCARLAFRSEAEEIHRKLMYDMAKLFDNTYVIDLREYGPEYDWDFHEKFYVAGHMSAAGYMLTAKMLESYIDYIIRHNMKDFKTSAFIGKDVDYYPPKE